MAIRLERKREKKKGCECQPCRCVFFLLFFVLSGCPLTSQPGSRAPFVDSAAALGTSWAPGAAARRSRPAAGHSLREAALRTRAAEGRTAREDAAGGSSWVVATARLVYFFLFFNFFGLWRFGIATRQRASGTKSKARKRVAEAVAVGDDSEK